MYSFRFKDDTYISNKQNNKTLSIRDLFAKIKLDETFIGEIQCYYLHSYQIFNVDKFFIDFSSDDFTEEEVKFMEERGINSEDDYGEYLENNYLYEDEYYDFIYDNDIEIVDKYIKKNKDILYIKEIKLYGKYDYKKIINELKNTLYILFNYKDFILINNNGYKIIFND